MQLRKSQLHVWVVTAPKRKVNAELRVELCELVEANKLIHPSCTRSDIERYPQLMSRDTAHDHVATIFPLDLVRPARARSFFPDAYAYLLLRGTMRRSDCDSAMQLPKSV